MAVKQDRVREDQIKCWGNLKDREATFIWEDRGRSHEGRDSHGSSKGKGYIVTRRRGTVGGGQ